MRKLYRSLLAASAVVGLAACGDDVTVTPPTPPAAPTVVGVTVSPASATIKVGETYTFTASVQTTGAGVNTAVAWSSANASVASVNATTGAVTGVAAGQTTIRATSAADAGIVGAAGVTVIQPGVTSVSATPTSATLVVGANLTAVATVVRDAGVAGTVTWVSSAPAIASVVSTTGVITAVAPGTAVITATSTADASKSGSMSVTVIAQSPALNSLTVTPTTASIGVGGTLPTTTIASAVPGATVTYANSSSNTAVATVTATGANPVITGVSSGTAVITIQATGSAAGFQTNSISATVTITARAAQISILSITAGAGTPGAGLPVVLTNVAGQIDANLNFEPAGLPIDSVIVSIQQPSGFVRAAKQNFGGTVPAAGVLTLSVNTANFTKIPATGVAKVDYFNGPTTLRAQVYPTSSGATGAVNCSNTTGDPNCAAPIQMILNNVDGWAADITKPTASAKVNVGGAPATLGSTYWGGPGAAGVTSATIYAVIYNNNPGYAPGSSLNRCTNQLGNGTGCISTVTWTVGSPAVGGAGTCALVTQVALPFTRTFGTAGASGCGYQNTTIIRDNIMITAAIDGQNNPFPLVGLASGLPLPANPNLTLIPNTTVFGSTPDSLRMDYVGPAVVAPTVVGAEGFNWVNAAWAFMPAGTKVTDGGVGPLEASWGAFASVSGGSATVFGTPVVTGADLAETNQNCTGAGCDGYNARATATDLLGNAANSGVTAAFGDDKTAPVVRYSSALTSPASISPLPSIYIAGGTSSTLDSTTYNAIQVLPAAGTADSIRIEALDNRSGLSREVTQSRRFAQGGATGASTSLACATSVGAFGASFGDGFRPGVQTHITCGSALAGYYTTTKHAVDRAGNVSGVTTAAPSATGGTNPAVPGSQNANLFYRRDLALDPVQPAVTGVSPNNNYAGNSQQTWSLGSQDDLEVIDARLRITYPNVTIGDAAGTVPGPAGLVWSYALSNTFMGAGFSAGPASGNGANLGYFSPIATRFDNSIINPQVTTLTQDQFTLNVQETCVGAAAPINSGPATGPLTAAACGTAAAPAAGDPIPQSGAGSIAATKPTFLNVQVRDVFGSWIFNSAAGAATGVSAEFTSPILSATVATPGGYSVAYSVLPPGCPQGNGAVGGPCVTGGATSINFRQDGAPAASVRNFRAVQPLSVTLPVFTRVELFGLNAASEWVFIQRCTVPGSIAPSGSAACGGGTITGSDNGLERYWVYSFTSIPTTGFTQFRALGVNSSGFGLFSTIQP